MLHNHFMEFIGDLCIELLQYLTSIRALFKFSWDESINGVQPLLLEWSECAVFYTLLHEHVVHLQITPKQDKDAKTVVILGGVFH